VSPPRLTVGSLFAGIGGFDLGFQRAGFAIRWQVEIDPFCRAVLEKHWPAVRRYADVRRVGREQLEPVDVLVGGDPCQRNSNAWRHGAGAESPAADFIRLVDELRPRFVVRENPTTVRADAPFPWWHFGAELERLGYAVLPFRLRACCLGADHRRDRLFLLAAVPDADGARLEGAERAIVAHAGDGRHDADARRSGRWSAASRICRGAHGVSGRVDRLRGLGNAVVPQVAEWIARQILAADGRAGDAE
jgi:DNA (cytosine-5)-methyltransferase 1